MLSKHGYKLRQWGALIDRIRSDGYPPAATAIKFLNFYYRYGFTLNNFFQYELYRDDIPLQAKLAYLPTRRLEHIWSTFNSPRYWSSFTNKYIFHCIAEASGLPVPALHGVLDRYTGFDLESQPLRTEQDLQRLLDEKQLSDLVIKPIEGKQGRHVYALEYHAESNGFIDLQRGALTFQQIFAELQNEKQMKASLYEPCVAENYTSFLIQQRLKQHPELVEMMGPMLAPLRMLTLVTGDGDIEILASRFPLLDHRKALSANHPDLISAPVDVKTGIIQPGAYIKATSLKKATSIETGNRPFAGEPCPHWEAAVDLARRAASRFQYCRCIGWDVAITPEGPVLLEGNTRWAVTSLQAPMKQGLFHSDLKKVYQELAGSRPRLAI